MTGARIAQLHVPDLMSDVRINGKKALPDISEPTSAPRRRRNSPFRFPYSIASQEPQVSFRTSIGVKSPFGPRKPHDGKRA
ncbi:hypothetical protein [uncultured Sutterella sp.]|uniref:hypothetical protein n=1 Tax=uncultured Sutterella sp. TaxID=286133 RepID=UPI00266C44F5|nr:hypothetical protein [uncultured Sutterella sp.]